MPVYRRAALSSCKYLYLSGLLLTTLLLFVFTYYARYTGFDGAVYVLMAEYFSPWMNTRDTILLDYLMPQTQFPPAYPILLGVLGVDSESIDYIHLINTCLFVAAMMLFAAWLNKLGENTWALILPLVFTLSPFVLLFLLGVWSEFMFLMLLMAALYLHETRQPTGKQLVLIAIIIALSIITRTIGIALLIAWLIVLIHQPSQHRPIYKLVYAAIAITPFLLWILYKRITGTGADYSRSVVDDLLINGAGYLVETPSAQAVAILNAWLDYFPFTDPATSWIALILLFLAIAGLVHRLLSWKLDALFVLIYLVIILFWPYPEFADRFLFPITPLLMFYASRSGILFYSLLCNKIAATPSHVLSLNGLLADRTSKHKKPGIIPGSLSHKIAGIIVPLLFLACIVQPTTSIAWRFFQLSSSADNLLLQDPVLYTSDTFINTLKEAAKRQQLVQSIGELRKIVPEDACLYSTMTAQTMLYARRKAVLTPDISDLSHLTACDYVLTIAWKSGHRDAFFPIRHLLKHEHYQLIYSTKYEGQSILLLFRSKSYEAS